jgi:hypothetical protein
MMTKTYTVNRNSYFDRFFGGKMYKQIYDKMMIFLFIMFTHANRMRIRRSKTECQNDSLW